MAQLLVVEPGRVAVVVPVVDRMVIGRDPSCDVILADRHTSRVHAELERQGDLVVVVDRGSRHGLTLNGDRVARATLRDGDSIRIGNAVLTYAAGDQPGALLLQRTTDDATPLGGGQDARRLRVFHDVGRALAGLEHPDAVMERLLESILATLECDGGVVGILAHDGAAPWTVARSRSRVAAPGVPRAAIDAATQRREAVTLPGAMCAPLCARSRVHGFVYVFAHSGRTFSGEDLGFLTVLAQLAAAAFDGAERVRRAEAVQEAELDERPVEMLGASPAIAHLRDELDRFAGATAAPVHLRGESGVGKELAARLLHSRSPRAGGPFVAVNCGALPDTLVESELFGHVRGAFTGATRDRRGRFVQAHRGTLLLDEVAELSAAAQVKLLRVLDDGQVQPVGGERPVRVDVRVVSATHRDLRREVAEGRFREDLYFRLAILEVYIAPLRERRPDISLLAGAMLERAAQRLGKRLSGFDPDAAQALLHHPWPGNVRELSNEVERAAILAEGDRVRLADLGARVRAATAPPPEVAAAPPAPLADRFAHLDLAERQLVEEAMAAAAGNVTAAARLLGISRIMMRRRLARMGLAEIPDDKEPEHGEATAGTGDGTDPGDPGLRARGQR